MVESKRKERKHTVLGTILDNPTCKHGNGLFWVPRTAHRKATHNTAQHNTAQHITAQHGNAIHSTEARLQTAQRTATTPPTTNISPVTNTSSHVAPASTHSLTFTSCTCTSCPKSTSHQPCGSCWVQLHLR